MTNCWTCPSCVQLGYNKIENITKSESKSIDTSYSSSNASISSYGDSLDLSFSSIQQESIEVDPESVNIVPEFRKYRRSKQNIKNSKQISKNSKKLKLSDVSNDSSFEIDTLTTDEKKIILKEFCDDSSQEQDSNHKALKKSIPTLQDKKHSAKSKKLFDCNLLPNPKVIYRVTSTNKQKPESSSSSSNLSWRDLGLSVSSSSVLDIIQANCI